MCRGAAAQPTAARTAASPRKTTEQDRAVDLPVLARPTHVVSQCNSQFSTNPVNQTVKKKNKNKNKNENESEDALGSVCADGRRCQQGWCVCVCWMKREGE